MEEESILKKLEKLSKMRRLLKEKKIRRIKDKKLKFGRLDFDDEDDEFDYDDDLLSHAELIEEALKEYMYQFGMSIYQNKQGDYYFKQFENNVDTRDFEELDTHHFSLREKEPSFLEKILEVVPESKIHLTDNMETAVMDLYEKDATMSDILDQMVENEIEKCREILKDSEALDLKNEQQLEIQNQNVDYLDGADKLVEEISLDERGVQVDKAENPSGDGTDSEAPQSPASDELESYQCGEDRVEKIHISKPLKVRRVKKSATQTVAPVVKDNSNVR